MTARWAFCPGCDRERPITDPRGQGVMAPHRRYDEAAQAMVPCEGSGLPPAPERAEGDAA